MAAAAHDAGSDPAASASGAGASGTTICPGCEVLLCVGSVPWNALSFSTMWLQYVGFSDATASLVTGMAILGVCLGNILGGYLGDAAAAMRTTLEDLHRTLLGGDTSGDAWRPLLGGDAPLVAPSSCGGGCRDRP